MSGAVRAALAFVGVSALSALLASQGCEETEESPVRRDDARPTASGGESSAPAPEVAPGRARAAAADDAVAESGSAVGDDAMPPGRISGRVTDDAGAVIEGATARVFLRSPRARETSPLLADTMDGRWFGPEVRTGPDGRFETEFPAEGWHRVHFAKPGYASVVELCKSGRDDADATLPRLVATPFLVVDEARAPIGDAEIRCSHDEFAPPYLVLRTDADGRATAGLAAPARVAVRATGFATEGRRLDRDEVGEPCEVVLVRGLPVAGRVEDLAGRPVAGAAVRIERPGGLSEESATDGEGRFVFDAAGASEALRIDIHTPGFADQAVPVVPGDVGVRIVLRRAGRVSGTAVDVEGRPVARTRIGRVDLGPTGAFDLSLPEGPQTIAARAPWPGVAGAGLEGSVQADVPGGGAVEDVKIVLRPVEEQSFLEAEFDVPAPSGLPDLRLDVVGEEGATDLSWTGAPSGRSRVFVVPRRPGSAVTVTACLLPVSNLDPGFASVAGVVTSAAPPGPRVRLRLAPAPRVRVRVFDGDRERVDLLDDVEVHAATWRYDRSPDGTWAIRPDAPVTVRLRNGDPVRCAARLDPPHPPLRDVDLRWAVATTVTGRFVDARGRPAGIDGSAEIEMPSISRDLQRSVGPDGRFSFPNVPPGKAGIVLRTVHLLTRWEIDVPSAPTADVGDLVVAEETWFQGRVTDAAGGPLGGVRVAPIDGVGDELPGVSASGPDGDWRVRARPQTGLRFRLSKRGRGSVDVLAGAGARPLDTVLPPEGRVHVRIRRAPRGGLEELWLRDSATGLRLGPDVVPAERAAGDWESTTYAGLGPGRVDVVLTTGEGREIVRTVVVAPGETVTALFDE